PPLPSLAPSRLSRCRGLRSLAAGIGASAALFALGACRLGGLFGRTLFGALFGLLAPEPLGGCAQPAADTLRLGFVRGRRFIGFGVGVVFAADQLDLRDLGAVAAAV